MARRFAQDTSVSVEKSRAEIEAMLVRNGASALMAGLNATEAIIAFEMKDRKVIFRLPLPAKNEKRFMYSDNGRRIRTLDGQIKAWEQACRSRWRALALAIKAKLEAVAIGITTFEDEFLAHIMMPDGMTVGQHTRPLIAESYKSGSVPPLLPGPKS